MIHRHLTGQAVIDIAVGRQQVAGVGPDVGLVLLEPEHLGEAVVAVQGVAGDGDVALRELLRHGGHLHADAGVGAACGVDGAGIDLAEFGAGGLHADSVGVGDVVADHVQVAAGGIQAGESLLECHGGVLRGGGNRMRVWLT